MESTATIRAGGGLDGMLQRRRDWRRGFMRRACCHCYYIAWRSEAPTEASQARGGGHRTATRCRVRVLLLRYGHGTKEAGLGFTQACQTVDPVCYQQSPSNTPGSNSHLCNVLHRLDARGALSHVAPMPATWPFVPALPALPAPRKARSTM
jgi:hypothetical protein